MKDILYISYDGLTDPLGQSQILPYIKGLAAKGWRIDILSFEKPARFALREKVIKEICLSNNIGWYPMAYTKFPPVLSTMHDLNEMENKAMELHRENTYKIVHCRSYLASICGMKLKKLYKVKFIFDMRGFWADERVEGKIWSLGNPVYRYVFNYFKRKEKELLRAADAIISLTENARQEITKNLLPGYELPITVTPCAADLSHFDAGTVKENKKLWLRARHGLDPDDIIIGYVGSLGTWYLLDEMMEFFKKLHAGNSKLKFLIVSRDGEEPVKRTAYKKGLPESSVICVKAEREEVPRYMALMDAAMFFILPAFSKKASSPTKQGEFMAMGIPVYCNAGVGDTDMLVNKYQSGIVLEDLSPAAMQKAAARWKALLALDKEKIRAGAMEYFSLEKGVERYDEVYKTLNPKEEKVYV